MQKLTYAGGSAAWLLALVVLVGSGPAVAAEPPVELTPEQRREYGGEGQEVE
jgi:hypothetical protein